MKKIVLAIMMLSSMGSALADPLYVPETNRNITQNVTRQSTNDVVTFQNIMKNESFYAFLLSLGSELPDITHAGEYVMLINEMHLMNEKLAIIADELHAANQASKNRMHEGAT